jgi:site-specific DNA recombinase
MIGAVERGRHPGGNVFGLKKVRGKTEDEDDYFPDEDQAKIVFRVMWEIGVLERSYADIAHDLNRENVPSPRGGLWSAQNFVKSKSELGGLATNPRCIGVLQWNKASYPLNRETNTHTPKINPRSEWVIGYNANHQFIPIWLYQKVQAVVARRRTGTGGPKASVPRRLLTGQLKCGVCRTGTMRIIAADKYGRDRVGCAVYTARGDCNNGRTYYLDTIEKMVVTGLRDFLSSPELVAAQFEEASDEINRIRKDLEAERTAIEAEVEGLRPITADLVAKMADAGIDDGMVRHIVDRELKPIYEKQEGLWARVSEIGKLLSSDQLQISKIETKAGAMADLEKMLEETKGRNLPRDLINSMQALVGKVFLIPDPESRHFDLHIEGQFDALVGENYLGPLAVLNSREYKAGQMGGSRHFDKLTIGKQFKLTFTSRTVLQEADLEEVRQRRIDNLGSRTRNARGLDLRMLDAPKQ